DTFSIAPMAFGAELAEDFAPSLVRFRTEHSLLAQQQAQQRQPGEVLNRFNPERFACFWGARASRGHWSASRRAAEPIAGYPITRATGAIGGTPTAATETVALPSS